MKRILLTGATGMIGTAILNECAVRGIEAVAVVRRDSNRKKIIPDSKCIKVVECGLEEIEKLPSISGDGFDAFYHLSWANTDKSGRNDAIKQNLNIEYTLQAVMAAKKTGCSIFVGAGSQAEYGRGSKPISEDFPPAPETAYGATKLSAGKLSADLCSQFGIKHIWTRIFSVYGPNDSLATMIMYCIGKLLKKEKPLLTKCDHIWDYLYCSDGARALLLAGEKGKDGSVYNISSGICRPLIEYVKMLRNAINPGLELGIGEIEYGRDQVMHLCADISKIKKDTGFKPAV
ncbi:MAG: NAD(P)-dependent oxidoreductase, partial [Deltaproteobacteria bacterium]|nr:NAD(P)-dependent oxidoreductase [Deltaproteobacteria bacterium]